MDICCLNKDDRFLTSTLAAKLLKRFGGTPPTIICLGSDKVLSDMVGVLVADRLKQAGVKTYVYGGSNFVVTTKNIDYLLKKIGTNNILFVDSAVATQCNNIYFNCNGIKLKNNKIYDGASICAGTIFLKNNKLQLAGTPLKQVLDYVNKIVLAITDYFSFAS